MAATRLVTINANTGAWTSIASTITAGAVEIVEDGAVSPQQGLAAQFPADGYATTDTYPPGQTIELAAVGETGVLGLPAQNAPGAWNYRPADVYCRLRSATATPTTVRVVESET